MTSGRFDGNGGGGFHDLHKGERCVVMGNGPSLRRIDMSLLAGETTFGLNKIFLMFPDLGWVPTYYCAVNPLVIEQSREDILRSTMPKFIGHEGRRFLPEREDIFFLDSSKKDPGFAKSLDEPMWQGFTVTFCAIQVAFCLGFQEVVLVGVDHSYSFSGKPNQEVPAKGPDLNHFHPSYFSDGNNWNLPDLECSEKAYAIARDAFEQAGRRIVNATPGTMLDVFEKVPYNDIFATS